MELAEKYMEALGFKPGQNVIEYAYKRNHQTWLEYMILRDCLIQLYKTKTKCESILYDTVSKMPDAFQRSTNIN